MKKKILKIKIMNAEGKKIALLIMDPQNDFCSPRGSFFVPGADEDNHRLADFILDKKEEIDQIIVTLDSHYVIDISHPSFWINQNKLTKNKFIWQDDYWAESVCNIEPIRKYIHNQETHHSKNSFLKEVDDFMEKYDWE